MKRALVIAIVCALLVTSGATAVIAVKPTTPPHYTFDVSHQGAVVGTITVKQTGKTSETTYSASANELEANTQHWLYYTTASGAVKYVGTEVSTKNGMVSITGTWTNDIGDLAATPAPTFTLSDSKQATTLTLAASPPTSRVGDTVTFTATLTPPLIGQAVSLIAPDGSAQSGTTGSDGTCTWTTSFSSAGSYVYYARFAGNEGYAGDDSSPVTVTVNQPPVADAGSDQTVTVNTQVTLDGTGSKDPDGDPITYTWSIQSQPAGSDVQLSDSTASQPTFTPVVTGDYVFSLTVTDSRGGTSDPATVTVTAAKAQSAIRIVSWHGGLADYWWSIAVDNGILSDTTTHQGIAGKTVYFYLPDRTTMVTDDSGKPVTAVTNGYGMFSTGEFSVWKYQLPSEDYYGHYKFPLLVYFPGDDTHSEAWGGYTFRDPTVAWTADVYTGTAPLTVHFTDKTIGTGPFTYKWDFNDDGVIDSTEQNPTYTYTSAGEYVVYLYVTWPGGSDQWSGRIVVT